jgi:hypothetical protein
MPAEKEQDVSARMRRRQHLVEDATERVVREIEESGALRHMHGKPLDLNDDPDWLMARVLKDAGFSHPVIERQKEILAPLQALQPRLERLSQRRNWLLLRPDSSTRAEDARVFNLDRDALVEEYRSEIADVNRGIRDFNLSAPEALHQRALKVAEILAGVEAKVPRLSPELVPSEPAVKAPSLLRRLLKRG